VADERRYSFQRYAVEGLQVLPLFDRAVVLALHGWGLFTHASPDQDVPFYLMPSLGGAYALRGYSNYRFHDRHLLLASAEARWPIFVHLDGAVFVDSGTVAADVRDLGFDRTIYGFGVRLHTNQSTIARFDVAHTGDGWGVMFRTSDPFNLDRLTRWTAALPFVP
jgi:outer membrane protein assembly factor BamA